MRQEIEEWLESSERETIFFEGLDMAIIGITEVPDGYKVCYDIGRVLELLIISGMTEEEAIEYYDFNVAGSYVGPLTPIFIQCVH
jgi:hypothetical protein|tara:strand:- start:913 stop:1167 length:255 start_codon:yes stop_codon:yes gene_type:complete